MQQIQDSFKMMKKGLLPYVILLLLPFACIPVFGQMKYTVEKLPLKNDGSNDFAPVFYKNGIVFCSNRKRENFIVHQNSDGKPFYDLYLAVKNKKTKKWNTPSLLNIDLATLLNDGPIAFTKDSTKVFFSHTLPNNDKSKPAKMGLFSGTMGTQRVTNIQPFKFNSPDYNVGHPSISQDGKKLFFASDKPGGFGGFDLYVCILVGKNWTEPKNLGSAINTPGNEIFPYIHSSGRLYFSSNQHKSSGGYDIFYSDEIEGEWQPVERLEEPINSTADDFSYITNKTFESGYFSSNRNKSDDIYSFSAAFPTFDNCDTLRSNNYCFTFFEEGTIDLDTTSLKYEWDLGDGTKIRSKEASHCFNGPGNYFVQLNVIDTITNEILTNQASYDFPIKDIEQASIISKDTVKQGNPILFEGSDKYLPNFNTIDYYWDFGDGNRQVGSDINHSFAKPGKYNVKLGILGLEENSGDNKKACVTKTIVVFR
jgi:hypothetical protein